MSWGTSDSLLSVRGVLPAGGGDVRGRGMEEEQSPSATA